MNATSRDDTSDDPALEALARLLLSIEDQAEGPAEADDAAAHDSERQLVLK